LQRNSDSDPSYVFLPNCSNSQYWSLEGGRRKLLTTAFDAQNLETAY